ncbi:helix-turn-helix transcriptional regulator [Streptomyces sp. NPDC094154]|uniref:helix-turn-helix transcriptional regulator n=1 Tax=Streptomyces sp. NPDC094154 TaxID=3366059 RepID=UPI0038222065
MNDRVTPPRASEKERRKLGTAQEVADYLQVPLATIYAWNYKGTGPKPIKVGRHVRYRWDDVESYLDALQAGGAA